MCGAAGKLMGVGGDGGTAVPGPGRGWAQNSVPILSVCCGGGTSDNFVPAPAKTVIGPVVHCRPKSMYGRAWSTICIPGVFRPTF